MAYLFHVCDRMRGGLCRARALAQSNGRRRGAMVKGGGEGRR